MFSFKHVALIRIKKNFSLFGIILFGLMAISCSSIYEVTRPVLQGIPDEHDATKNYSRVVQNDTLNVGFRFVREVNKNIDVANILVDEKSMDAAGVPLYEFVKLHKTLSFAIIRNDTVLYEYYAPKFSPEKNVTSFSMAKTFVAMLIGIAIEDGKINSVNDAITDYIPELKKVEGLNQITINNLLQHTSGIKFSKQLFNPWSDQSKFYYTSHLRKRIMSLKIESPPNQSFNYASVNTMLLALILENVTGMCISKYLEIKIWSQIDMEAPATWNTDCNNNSAIEKAFCGLNARTIDFAKFGRLLLNKGNWNGKQIIPEAFILDAITPSLKDGGKINYGYMGIGPKKCGSYYSSGLYGQLIYIYPERNIIIVRFGKCAFAYHPEYWRAVVLQIIDQL